MRDIDKAALIAETIEKEYHINLSSKQKRKQDQVHADARKVFTILIRKYTCLTYRQVMTRIGLKNHSDMVIIYGNYQSGKLKNMVHVNTEANYILSLIKKQGYEIEN